METQIDYWKVIRPLGTHETQGDYWRLIKPIETDEIQIDYCRLMRLIRLIQTNGDSKTTGDLLNQ